MSNICCVFGEYSDEMAKKPVSDGEKVNPACKKNHQRVDGNLNEAFLVKW